MSKKDLNYSEMSNNELKLTIESLENEFTVKKQSIKTLCDELVELENEYKKATSELNIRKTVY